MKTQNLNKLHFQKGTIVELNREQLNNVEGGSSIPCGVAIAVASNMGCFLVSVIVGGIIYTANP